MGWPTGRRESRASVVGRTLAELLESLGPTYVKLGQILSTRRDLLGEPTIRHLERLQDQLTPIDEAHVATIFREEFDTEIDDAFASFDSTPIASASIASVYRATLHDGRIVAVKIKRPGIGRIMHADVRLLRIAARFCGSLPPLRGLPMLQAVDDLGSCILRQLDFRLEATANRRLRVALAWESQIRIPKLVDEYCGASVLTMDYIEEISQREQHGPNAPAALLASLRALYRMIFVEGLVHCDMHQGNLHFLPNGEAALIDFGFVAELPDVDRLKFAEFFYAMATNDGSRCAEITLETAAFVPADLKSDEIDAAFTELVGRSAGARASDFLVADFVLGVFDIQRRHGIVGSTAFTMAILSLLVFEGIARDVFPDLDFQGEAHPYILRASIRPYKPPAKMFDSEPPSSTAFGSARDRSVTNGSVT